MPEAPGVYIQEFEIGAKPIEGVSTSTVGFVGLTEKGEEYQNIPTLITSWANFVEKFGRYDPEKAPYLPAAVYGFFVNGGGKCYVVKVENAESYIGTDEGPGQRTGLNALTDIDEVAIVCIPGCTDQGVQLAMINHCQILNDRFCILDAPEESKIVEVKEHRQGLTSEKGYAALYYPWIKAPYEIKKGEKVTQKTDKFLPPSGHVAGVYARSDTERGVHKAPANEVLRDALELKLNITQGEQETLNPDGINCIRAFKGRGIRVWGARTISKDTLWKYVNVRRLFIYLEESIEEGTQWVVFEPNGPPLWARVRQSITQFLTTAWRDGYLLGTTPEEAFFVKCDRTTMSDDDINNGRLICIVGVAPMKPAEFIIIRIAQLTQSAKS